MFYIEGETIKSFTETFTIANTILYKTDKANIIRRIYAGNFYNDQTCFRQM